MMKFQAFLAQKSQSYDNINRFRAQRIFFKYQEKFGSKKIIQIIGTNGKGSTGRFLAQILHALNFKVGHFTSPHIFDFNERFWLNGEILANKALNLAHIKLLKMLGAKDLNSLSYFEYASFLAFLGFEECDFLIFEAGLGGEFDASSVFEKELCIFTPISFDHTQILGEKIAEISRTKLKAMSKNAIISDLQENETLKIAQKIALLKNANLFKMSEIFDKFQAEIFTEFENYAIKFSLPNFLKDNLKLALCSAFLLLNLRNFNDKNTQILKAISNLKKLDLNGRCQEITPNLFVDVGHNAHAASAILSHFQRHFKGQKFVLIYNAFLDKNIAEILKILKVIIKKIEIFSYKSERKLGENEIKKVAKTLNIKCEKFTQINKNEKYLVFGSFMLVENFLRFYKNSKKF